MRLILHGYLGRMGNFLRRMTETDETVTLVAGIDSAAAAVPTTFPAYTDIWECDMPADVLVDFSRAEAVDSVIEYGLSKKLPLVICTTGLSQETIDKLKAASAEIPIFFSANMSLGVNLLARVLADYSKKLYELGFDVEIVEAHHHNKLDAPSGTALFLAETINNSLDEPLELSYDRSQLRQKRPRAQMGIHSIRGGSIVGEHQVIFAGQEELITINHSTQSREIFAQGAMAAAKFISTCKPGMYSMEDMLGNK